ncbi:SapC family protein [Qipengyuania sp. XHP0207]|uniref:SapC family protein n=1 Tax=Qipengyuania sp. XHP0207 TaxID=3038078 RepID=UPI00241E2E36|nr:SapC family protein [Qipengyuania sp. XHP0207]MDG5747288.1 SapC family protein [Qipengyuania sp. XHP0207]
MASAPQPNLPLFYNDLMPLNSNDHADLKTRPVDLAPWLSKQHAVPLTVDEFVQAQRQLPIVFSAGENALPLALFALNEGVNTFVDETGKVTEPVYLPAYIRRYPFMLARLRPDAEELSLCFDPTADSVGEFEDGDAFFDGKEPSEATKTILQFCESFEQAGQRTQAFMKELKDADLLMDGEVAIQRPDEDKPFIYRGFQMVNAEKLRELRGDQLRKWNESGLLQLIFAHLFSLEQMRVLFARQANQGTAPKPQAQLNGVEGAPAA